jgi:hypothetical protein
MMITLADEDEDIYLKIPDQELPEAIIYANRAWVRAPNGNVFVGKRTYTVEEDDDL